jgi:hypothetical protein
MGVINFTKKKIIAIISNNAAIPITMPEVVLRKPKNILYVILISLDNSVSDNNSLLSDVVVEEVF